MGKWAWLCKWLGVGGTGKEVLGEGLLRSGCGYVNWGVGI